MTIEVGLEPPAHVVDAAILAARSSPCAKSKRGCAVFRPSQPYHVAHGFNAPPGLLRCTGSDACRADCTKLCVHAEERAIRLALSSFGSLLGLRLVHAKVIDGSLVTSGGPSCWQCARTVVDVGIHGVYLYEDTARGPTWIFYSAFTFHEETLRACAIGPQGRLT